MSRSGTAARAQPQAQRALGGTTIDGDLDQRPPIAIWTRREHRIYKPHNSVQLCQVRTYPSWLAFPARAEVCNQRIRTTRTPSTLNSREHAQHGDEIAEERSRPHVRDCNRPDSRPRTKCHWAYRTADYPIQREGREDCREESDAGPRTEPAPASRSHLYSLCQCGSRMAPLWGAHHTR